MRVTTDPGERTEFKMAWAADVFLSDECVLSRDCEGFRDSFQAAATPVGGKWAVRIFDAYLRPVGWLCL